MRGGPGTVTELKEKAEACQGPSTMPGTSKAGALGSAERTHVLEESQGEEEGSTDTGACAETSGESVKTDGGASDRVYQ